MKASKDAIVTKRFQLPDGKVLQVSIEPAPVYFDEGQVKLFGRMYDRLEDTRPYNAGHQRFDTLELAQAEMDRQIAAKPATWKEIA